MSMPCQRLLDSRRGTLDAYQAEGLSLDDVGATKERIEWVTEQQLNVKVPLLISVAPWIP